MFWTLDLQAPPTFIEDLIGLFITLITCSTKKCGEKKARLALRNAIF